MIVELVQTFLKWLTGFLCFAVGLGLVGLDIHIAFRKTEFAHPTNIGLGVFLIVFGAWFMWVSVSVGFWSKVSEVIRNWRSKEK